MKITVKTAGLLSRHLPPGNTGSTAEIEVAEGATPIDVVVQLGMPPGESYLITLNGVSLPKADRATRTLSADDTLAIMPPLRGG